MENPTIEYYNPKYLKDPVYTITKNGDSFTMVTGCESLVEFDNKFSVSIFPEP